MSNEKQPRYVRILPSAVESKYSSNILKSGDIHKVDWQYTDGCFVIFSHDQRFGTIHIEPEHVQEVYVYDEPRVLPASEAQPTAKPMRVRVVKADENDWYCDKIGQEFKVLNDCGFYFYVLCNDELNTTYLIKSENCEVVKPEPEKMSDEQSAFLQRIAELKRQISIVSAARNITAKRLVELEKRVAKLEEQQSLTTEQLTQFSISLLKLSNAVSPIGSPLDEQQHAPQQESNLDKARRLYPKGVTFKSLGTVQHTIVSSGKFEEDHRGIHDADESFYVFLGGQWAEVVQPASDVIQWRLKVDVPEYELVKGAIGTPAKYDKEHIEFNKYIFPLSIMPHIADPVGDGT